MPPFARRFRRMAVAVVAFYTAITLGFLVAGAVLWDGGGVVPLVALATALALVAAGLLIAVPSFRRSEAIRAVARVNPDGVVFLARRQPSIEGDLAVYVPQADILDEISDRWVVASIDDRGMAAWSVGPHPRELVLMPWHHLGAVEKTRLEDGQTGVAVDVKPFPTPLVVAVGYSLFGVMAAFGRAAVAEVVHAANALRPPAPPDPPESPVE